MNALHQLVCVGYSLAFITFLNIFTGCVTSEESAVTQTGIFVSQQFKDAVAESVAIDSLSDINVIPSYTVVDETTGEIIAAFMRISGVVNACETPPCVAAAGNNIATFTITANNDVFTLQSNAASINFPIPDQPGAATLLGQYLGAVDIMQPDGSVVVHKVIADYTGVAVNQLVTADNIAELINPMFSEQILAVTLDNSNFSLSGTNMVSGLGSIQKTDKLPAGYEVTATNKGNYTFYDPDGDKFAALLEALDYISIAERDRYNQVVANNEAIYSVTLELSAPRELEKEDITIELDGAEWDVDNDQKQININKLTNACEIPPCIGAAADLLGVLTLTTVAEAFTLADGTTSIAFPIPDWSGAASVPNVKLGSITIFYKVNNSNVEYDVIATYHGTPVQELVTADNIADMINPMFDLQKLSASLDNTTIALTGVNLVSGTLIIDRGTNLPSGYVITATDLNTYRVDDPDGASIGATSVTEIAGLVIAEAAWTIIRSYMTSH